MPGFFVLKVTPSNFASKFTKVRNSYNSKSREAIDYIDRGTKESPGRYIPVLGKRLTNFPDSADFGFHPGIAAQNITNSVQKKIEKETGIKLEKMLRSW